MKILILSVFYLFNCQSLFSREADIIKIEGSEDSILYIDNLPEYPVIEVNFPDGTPAMVRAYKIQAFYYYNHSFLDLPCDRYSPPVYDSIHVNEKGETVIIKNQSAHSDVWCSSYHINAYQMSVLKNQPIYKIKLSVSFNGANSTTRRHDKIFYLKSQR